MDAAKRIAQWKWIIIDEVSMLSANFLAEIDMHLRTVMTQVNAMKRDENKSIGPLVESMYYLSVTFCNSTQQMAHH